MIDTTHIDTVQKAIDIVDTAKCITENCAYEEIARASIIIIPIFLMLFIWYIGTKLDKD